MDIEHVVQKLSRDYVALLACDGVRSENRTQLRIDDTWDTPQKTTVLRKFYVVFVRERHF
jgi:hypothetical protein